MIVVTVLVLRQAIKHVEEIAKNPEARKQYARIKEV